MSYSEDNTKSVTWNRPDRLNMGLRVVIYICPQHNAEFFGKTSYTLQETPEVYLNKTGSRDIFSSIRISLVVPCRSSQHFSAFSFHSSYNGY